MLTWSATFPEPVPSTMLHRLPSALKRQIRLMGCSAIARWRQYPIDLSSRYLTSALACAFQAKASSWQTSSTPIPTRGDEITCTNRRAQSQPSHRGNQQSLFEIRGSFQPFSAPRRTIKKQMAIVQAQCFKQGQVLSDAGGGPLPDRKPTFISCFCTVVAQFLSVTTTASMPTERSAFMRSVKMRRLPTQPKTSSSVIRL